jgi:hypothetical protein
MFSSEKRTKNERDFEPKKRKLKRKNGILEAGFRIQETNWPGEPFLSTWPPSLKMEG